jgi:aspartate racemase
MTTSTPPGRPLVMGMLGGMSWESTIEYYRLANKLVRDRLGGLLSARLVLASLDFAEIEQLQVAGEWDRAGRILADEAARLQSAGAELMVLCTNTMHKVADQVQAAIGVPLLHLADTAAASVRSAGVDTVGLLGTAFTMQERFYVDRLAGHGLTVLVPGPDDRALVHRTVYEELCQGVISPASRQAFREVIARLVTRGAGGVLLACTEIELLVGPQDSVVPVFPTTRLHVRAAVDAALAPPAPGGRPRRQDPALGRD